MEAVYLPGEDSYLLAKYVERYVHGSVLDMGTGSGVQAVKAALKPNVLNVVAVDINKNALIVAERRAKRAGVLDKITFLQSDLFLNIRDRFDWILFNPPYLPSEGEIDEFSWTGGDTGGEIINRFLEAAPNYLRENGGVLLVHSSFTGLDLEHKKYKWKSLEGKRFFFETIFCSLLKLTEF